MGRRMDMAPNTPRVSGGSAAVAVLGLVALTLIGLLALDIARSDRIAEGVSVGGIQIGGQSSEEAAVELRRYLVRPLRMGVVAEHGERRFRLGPQQAKLDRLDRPARFPRLHPHADPRGKNPLRRHPHRHPHIHRLAG